MSLAITLTFFSLSNTCTACVPTYTPDFPAYNIPTTTTTTLTTTPSPVPTTTTISVPTTTTTSVPATTTTSTTTTTTTSVPATTTTSVPTTTTTPVPATTTTSTTTTTTTSTTTTTTTTTLPDCAPGGWQAFGGYIYCLGPPTGSQTSQSAARAACQALGADLASVHSTAENDFLYTLSGPSPIWLGSIRLPTCNQPDDNTCFVNLDGTPFDYDNWAVPRNIVGNDNLPYPPGTYCVSGFWYGPNTWTDVGCEPGDPYIIAYKYICKRLP